MSDIVERLRGYPVGPADMMALFVEAADEVARLREALEKARDSIVEMEAYHHVPGAISDPLWKTIRTNGAKALQAISAALNE